MGHTRMTTQGSEKQNRNNHPFYGSSGGTHFALSHNGVLYNDHALRKQFHLSLPKIETDSYIAVQLIEQKNALNFDSLKYMAETVEGSFSFTVLDHLNQLYFIKGDNPLCLYHFPKNGVYLYASTEAILKKSLRKMHLFREKPMEIKMEAGDILKINRYAVIEKQSFNPEHLFHCGYRGMYGSFMDSIWQCHGAEYTMYLDEIKSVAASFGYSSEDIDSLRDQGFSCEEIENAFYSMEC